MLMQERLKDVVRIVKQKNPTLLLTIQKGALQTATGGMITKL